MTQTTAVCEIVTASPSMTACASDGNDERSHHHGHSHDDGEDIERLPCHVHNHGSVDHSHDIDPLTRFDHRPANAVFTRLMPLVAPPPDPGPSFRHERPPRM
jgi:hypothetical protein